MSKLHIVLCAVLFASAATASSSISKVEEEFKGTEQKLIQAIQKYYTGQFSFLNEILTDVQQITEKTNVEIQKLNDAAVGVDTADCLKLSSIREAGSDAIGATTACIADKLGPGNKLIDSIQKTAADVRADIPKIKNEAENCGDNVSLCAEAEAKATWISTNVIPDLNNKVNEVYFLWETLSPSLADCRTTKELNIFYTESSTVVERVDKCIQQTSS